MSSNAKFGATDREIDCSAIVDPDRPDIAVVGMPGAGKTTLLLCLLALASDITHEVFIFTSAFL
jgi:ABC-type Mn2+/Zn2+ transport system ATPase subunit